MYRHDRAIGGRNIVLLTVDVAPANRANPRQSPAGIGVEVVKTDAQSPGPRSCG